MAWAETIAGLPAEAVRYAKVALRAGRLPEVAASLHGLVSQACHADKRYQTTTDAYRR
jgi:hypothetical protein